MNDKLLSLLGIARRAGRLTLGFDAAADSMRNGRTKLLLLAGDLSERTVRSISNTAQQTNTEIIRTDIPMQQLGAAIGKATGIISVNDAGFAGNLKRFALNKDRRN